MRTQNFIHPSKLHKQAPSTKNQSSGTGADTPKVRKTEVSINLLDDNRVRNSYISHCKVENLTASTRSRKPATSCSIRVSVSLIRISWPLASSRIRPFSRFKSNRTDACVRPISSRSREFSFARSAAIFSCDERVNCASVESAFRSSERSLAKSTFWVYVDRSESITESRSLDTVECKRQGKASANAEMLTLAEDHRPRQVLNGLLDDIIQHTHHSHGLFLAEPLGLKPLDKAEGVKMVITRSRGRRMESALSGSECCDVNAIVSDRTGESLFPRRACRN